MDNHRILHHIQQVKYQPKDKTFNFQNKFKIQNSSNSHLDSKYPPVAYRISSKKSLNHCNKTIIKRFLNDRKRTKSLNCHQTSKKKSIALYRLFQLDVRRQYDSHQIHIAYKRKEFNSNLQNQRFNWFEKVS